MSTGAQIEMDWAGLDAASGGSAAPPANGANGAGAAGEKYLTDEEILGIDPPSPKDGYGGQARERAGNASKESTGDVAPVGARHSVPLQPANAPEASSAAQGQAAPTMPEWMAAAAGDPRHGAEAQRLWQEHQAFRASFSSPEEARAIKELFPGGAQEAQTLRQAAQAVDQLDAAIYSGDSRAQSEVVAELARANPAAFRQLFSEAAKVLAGLGQALPVNQTSGVTGTVDERWGTRAGAGQALPGNNQTTTLRENREGWGAQQNFTQQNTTQQNPAQQNPVQQNPFPQHLGTDQFSSIENRPTSGTNQGSQPTNYRSPDTNHDSRITTHESPLTNHQSPVTGHQSPHASPQFDPAAYAAFERSTNDTVARDVRVAVGDALTRVLPEGIAEGAARRIGDDIFNEIHRTLASDRTLSEQIGEILRGSSRESTANGWRFGIAEQQRVASLLASRAKQLVPGVARRVIGEWTSSVLGASRSKSARQASAAARVDIAAPGGSLD
jgi:hypothetical protein